MTAGNAGQAEPPTRKPDRLPELRGAAVLLRSISQADVTPSYLSWMNDPKVVRYTESRFQIHTLDSLETVVSGVLADPDLIMWAICRADDRAHVGNIKLGPINWRHGLGDIGLIIGDRACWGKGFATEAISLLSGYAFGALRLHKLTASMYADNIGSRRAFEKAGFEIEGVRRSHFRLDDRFTDLVLMGRINAGS
jgi:RimJ/RimL family protein N-acetyltransferase